MCASGGINDNDFERPMMLACGRGERVDKARSPHAANNQRDERGSGREPVHMLNGQALANSISYGAVIIDTLGQ